MADYPLDTAGRAKQRDAIRKAFLEKAERDARLFGLSYNCEYGRIYGNHPTNEPGCANNGTGCLCECHDQDGGEA